MAISLDDVRIFAAVARAGGFREASRAGGASPSRASEAVRRLETEVGIPLLQRTTRTVVPTEAGARLLERLVPALAEIDSALDVAKSSRDQPAGTLRLNVPTIAARTILPRVLPSFLAAHPDVRVEVTAEDGLVDVLAAGCDAGIRYEETLDQDMVAVPIGPRVQSYALVASPAHLERHGTPKHPRDLLRHPCLRLRFSSGRLVPWEFERGDETVRVDPSGPIVANLGNAVDLLIESAVEGVGVLYLFEELLEPYLRSGALRPLLKPWWPRFTGPFVYYPSRRLMTVPLRAFIDFVKDANARSAGRSSRARSPRR